MHLLLSSNSTLHGEPYMAFCAPKINSFLEELNVKEIVFIPYAAVTFSYDEYVDIVKKGLNNDAITVKGIHTFDDPIKAIEEAEAIMVGGGNTWKLLYTVYENDLVEAIQEKVDNGVPYVGWSAGSNLACPTLMTTNDMPIVEPISFRALELIPFQINPHYMDANPNGHNGETREQRLLEFIEANKKMYVAGLREGCIFEIHDSKISLIGNKSVRIFKYGEEVREESEDFGFLMK